MNKGARMEAAEIDALCQEDCFEAAAMPELHPVFSLFVFDGSNLKEQELSEIVEGDGKGIEKTVKGGSGDDEEEQEEYVKSASYEAENSYAQKNPYAPKKNYERVEQIKPKEEEEEKSFLWR